MIDMQQDQDNHALNPVGHMALVLIRSIKLPIRNHHDYLPQNHAQPWSFRCPPGLHHIGRWMESHLKIDIISSESTGPQQSALSIRARGKEEEGQR